MPFTYWGGICYNMDTMQIKLMVDNYNRTREKVRKLFNDRGFEIPKEAQLVVDKKRVTFVWTKGYVTYQKSMTIDEVEMDENEYQEYKGK